MSADRPPRRRLTLIRIATLLGLLCSAPCLGAEPLRVIPIDAVERIAVPDDRPKDWPFRDVPWIPMKRADFERLWSRRLPPANGPAQPAWRQVRYSAALVGDALIGGRLQAELQKIERPPRLLSLGSPSLAIEELTWDRQPAIWGSGIDGRNWLQLPADRTSLEGRWTARGRPLESGVVFQLELLPAAVSQLELQVPRGFAVVSDVGDVEQLTAGPEEAAVPWRISLGHHARCRLMITKVESSDVAAPTMLYKQELALTVSQDELMLQQTLNVEILEGDVRRLTISMPRQADIVSATYGDQTPLKFERLNGEGPAAQLLVVLPEGVQGRLRPIRLDGFLRRGAGEAIAAPQFALEGGLWLEGGVNVSIVRPLELRSYRTTGYRQAKPVAQRAESEVTTFQQLTPRAQLVLNVERPAVERHAHVLNRLTTDQRLWTLTAEIAWELRSGTVFDASCRLPEGWRVIKVVRLGSGRESQELTGWEVQAHPESGLVLSLEFPEGLTPGRVDSVRVIARSEIAPDQFPSFVPLVLPLECENAEVLLQLDASARSVLQPGLEDQFEPFDVRTAADVWNTLPSWSATFGEPGELLQLIHPESNIPLPQDAAARWHAAADVRVTLTEDRVSERFDIRLRQLTPAVKELELIFPTGGAEIRWTANDDPAELQVIRRQQSHVKSSDGGEICVLTLPEFSSDELTLIGRREVVRGAAYEIPIVLMPQARHFQGRVLLEVDRADAYRLREVLHGKESPEIPAELLTARTRELNYRTSGSEWFVEPAHGQPASVAPLVCSLKSVLACEEPGYDYHQFSLASPDPRVLDDFRFRLAAPAELVSMTSNQRVIPVSLEGDEFVASFDGSSAVRTQFAVSYRIPVAASFGRVRHRFEIPRFDRPCSDFTWQVCLPPAMEFRNSPVGLTWTPPQQQLDWRSRLLGPLSQPPGESLAAFQRLTAPETAAGESHPHLVSVSATQTADIRFPADWRVCSAAQSGLPDAQDFIVWNRQTLTLTTWVLLLGCLPAGMLLRCWSGTWRNRCLAIMLGGAACFALFGPDAWNELGGGVFSGLLLSLLLPFRVGKLESADHEAPVDQSASTEIFRRAAMPFAFWLALCASVPWSAAQDAAKADPRLGAEASPRGSLRVLIPIGRDEKPSQTLPVVYVSEALSEALNRPGDEDVEPTQLIASAEYLVYPDQNRRLALKVKYVIDRISADDSPMLLVPLNQEWRRGLEACYVNGRLQPAATATDGRFLNVPCEPATAAEGSTSHADVRRYEVLLEIRLPKAMDAGEGQFHADVFPVLNSRLSWQSPEALRHFELLGARGSVAMSLDRRLLEAQLGSVERWSLSRTRVDQFSSGEGRADLQLLQLLTLRPGLTQTAFRIECRVVEGAVSRMELDLPPGGVLRDLRGHKLLRTFVRPQREAGVRAVLEFDEPLRQTFVVEGEYVLANSAPDHPVDFPRLQVRCGQSSSVKQTVGVVCSPEFTAQLINPDDSAVQLVRGEQLVAQWGDTVPHQHPLLAFQVQEGGKPLLRLMPLPSEQQLLAWQEDITLFPRRLDWALTADVKAADGPVFSFSALIDRRLTIGAVSVRENGTDYPLRWSKTPIIGSGQNRLTVFLQREAAGTFQVRIHGSIRYRPATPMTLPSVRFETSQSLPGTLTLFHEDGHRLLLEGRQTVVDAAVPAPNADPDHVPVKFFRRLRISEGESGLTAQLEPVAGACSVQTLWLLDPSVPNWKLRGWMELTPEAGTREISVLVPDWLNVARITPAEGTPQPVEQIEQGQRRLQLTLSPEAAQSAVLLWDAEIPAVKEASITFTLPTVLHVLKTEELAAVRSESGWGVFNRPSVAVNTIPAVMREQLTQWDAASIEALFRLEDHVWPVSRVATRIPDDQPHVMLVEHALHGTSDGGWQGRTDLYPSPVAGGFDVSLPVGAEIESLVGDQSALPLTAIDAEAKVWRISDSNRYRRLTIHWKLPAPTLAYGFAGWVSLPLPHCAQDNSPNMLVTLSGRDSPWLIASGSWQRRPGWELSFDHLEMELGRHRRLREAQALDPTAGSLIWREYRATAESLSSPEVFELLTDDQRRRWEGIVQAVSQIEEPPGRESGSPFDLPGSFHASGERNVLFGSLTPDSAELNLWLIRRDALSGIAAAGLMLACVWLLPGVAGWLLSPWWQTHRNAAWLLCGAVWWFCWSPAIVGLAMMAWAAASWLNRRRTSWTAAVQ